jgi:hypothetical protein
VGRGLICRRKEVTEQLGAFRGRWTFPAAQDRDADCVWQGRGGEPQAVGVQLRGQARGTAPFCESAVQGRSPASHSGIGVPSGQVGPHRPYRQAAELLREVRPLDKAISLGSTRRRILAVGNALDAEIERDIAFGRELIGGDRVRESISVGCVSVDSAWVNFSSSPKSRKAARDLEELKSPRTKKLVQERHVNIVAGRATFTDRTPRLFAYAITRVGEMGIRFEVNERSVRSLLPRKRKTDNSCKKRTNSSIKSKESTPVRSYH